MDYIDSLLIMEDDLDDDENLHQFGHSSLIIQMRKTRVQNLIYHRKQVQVKKVLVPKYLIGVFVVNVRQCHKR